jgi:GNAT superfamily N-acetyltransferase
VTRIAPENAEAVAGFFRKVWNKDATGEEVRRARAEAARSNPATSGADVPAVVYLHEGTVIGHLGTIPVKFWNGNTETAAHWLKGFMVLPEHQNGPVGFAVLKELLKHVDVSGAMVVGLPARRLFKAVGFVDCGVIPNYICVLNPARVAKSIDVASLGLGLPPWLHRSVRATQTAGVASAAGAAGGFALRALRVLSVKSSPDLYTDLSGSVPQQAVNALWSTARSSIAGAAVRDGAFLSWRYSPSSEGAYEAVGVYERAGEKRLVAVAVVRRWSNSTDPRLRGIKVATLSDILFRPDDRAAGLAAIAGAERAARRMGADAILCSAAHPSITSLLRAHTYFRLPGNVHLMVRDVKATLKLPPSVDAWWVTRGDGQADELF